MVRDSLFQGFSFSEYKTYLKFIASCWSWDSSITLTFGALLSFPCLLCACTGLPTKPCHISELACAVWLEALGSAASLQGAPRPAQALPVSCNHSSKVTSTINVVFRISCTPVIYEWHKHSHLAVSPYIRSHYDMLPLSRPSNVCLLISHRSYNHGLSSKNFPGTSARSILGFVTGIVAPLWFASPACRPWKPNVVRDWR